MSEAGTGDHSVRDARPVQKALSSCRRDWCSALPAVGVPLLDSWTSVVPRTVRLPTAVPYIPVSTLLCMSIGAHSNPNWRLPPATLLLILLVTAASPTLTSTSFSTLWRSGGARSTRRARRGPASEEPTRPLPSGLRAALATQVHTALLVRTAPALLSYQWWGQVSVRVRACEPCVFLLPRGHMQRAWSPLLPVSVPPLARLAFGR